MNRSFRQFAKNFLNGGIRTKYSETVSLNEKLNKVQTKEANHLALSVGPVFVEFDIDNVVNIEFTKNLLKHTLVSENSSKSQKIEAYMHIGVGSPPCQVSHITAVSPPRAAVRSARFTVCYRSWCCRSWGAHRQLNKTKW